jgi:hypothetical protein
VSIFSTFVGITPGLRATIERNDFSHQAPAVDGAAVRAPSQLLPPLAAPRDHRRASRVRIMS